MKMKTVVVYCNWIFNGTTKNIMPTTTTVYKKIMLRVCVVINISLPHNFLVVREWPKQRYNVHILHIIIIPPKVLNFGFFGAMESEVAPHFPSPCAQNGSCTRFQNGHVLEKRIPMRQTNDTHNRCIMQPIRRPIKYGNLESAKVELDHLRHWCSQHNEKTSS